jgi:endonuclease/exonuclease/phosphatase family metal-dependent hydrolase
VPSPAPEEPAPIETAPATITLASFNLLHLGWNNGKNLDDLAAILARYDIIALQEVMKKSGNDDDPLFDLKLVRDKVQALTASDGAPVWEFQVTSESLGRSTYREYYAILYRTDRVQYVGGASVFADEHDVFIREPFFATFRAGNFDFTLITMHAIGPGDPLLDAEISGLKKVFLSVQDGSACENDVLLVGDFNKPADKSAWAELRTIPTIRNLIPSTTKTSIGKSGMANAYDNIWIQDQHTDWEYSGNSGAYYYFNDLYADAANRYQRARTVLSDHVPVWAEFRTDLEDDDGPCP